MNIFYSVLGGPTPLKIQKTKRFNGSLEAFYYLWILTRNPSFNKIFILSNDWDKLNDYEKQFIDPQKRIVPLSKETFLNDLSKEKIDFCIFKGGYGWGRVNFKNKIWKNNKQYFTPLEMQATYGAPILEYLNTYKVPYLILVSDPRTIHKTCIPRYDTIHQPLEIMAQISYDVKIKHIKEISSSFNEQEFIYDIIPVRYRKLEKITSIFYKENKIPEKDLKLVLPMMQDCSNNCKKSRRFELLKEWIFKYDAKCEVNIYGRWDEYFTKQYKQFKGFLEHTEIDKIMARTKYTLVIGIGENWATGKYAEAIALDVIPFIMPDYDTQFNAIPKNSWIRVNTPEELNLKIEFLENNPQVRLQILKDLKATLFKDVENGIFFYKEINKAISTLGLRISEEQDLEIKRKTFSLF